MTHTANGSEVFDFKQDDPHRFDFLLRVFADLLTYAEFMKRSGQHQVNAFSRISTQRLYHNCLFKGMSYKVRSQVAHRYKTFHKRVATQGNPTLRKMS